MVPGRKQRMASCTPAFIPTISRACNRTLRRQRSPLPSLCPAHHARVSLVTVSPSSFRSQHAFNRAERGVFMVTESESPNAPSSGESEYLSDFRPEPPMSDLTTSRGFALEEAKTHTFEAFNLDQSAFQTGGAYAISDASDTVMYMGYTKNIATKLSFHQRLQPQSCKTFRVYVPPVPPELMSPEMLESVLEYWVRENGSVPRGNTIDRALWEQEKPIDRQSSSKSTASNKNVIPERERTTSRRPSAFSKSEAKYYSSDPFTDAYRSARPKYSNSSKRGDRASASGWDPTDDDYVQVDADPFDPFSASNRDKNTTRSSWNDLEDESNREEWYPIFLIMGFAGIVWIFGLLSNALPAATPSLGM